MYDIDINKPDSVITERKLRAKIGCLFPTSWEGKVLIESV
jgi:hypothetical protein